MQKMKNGKKVLSVCLSLAMAAGMLSTSGGDGGSYQAG